MSVHVSAEESAAWEASRDASNAAYAAERHAKEVRERPALIASLQAEVEDLQTRDWFARECLAAALILIEELHERLMFERDILAAVLEEQHGRVDLPRAA